MFKSDRPSFENSYCIIFKKVSLVKKRKNFFKKKFITYIFDLKVFILPRVAELFIHKEKQRGCPLLGANRYTHIYISYICVYVLFICLRL